MTGFALAPYIFGVSESVKRILNNCDIKVTLKPFLTLVLFFQSLKILSRLSRELMLFTLYPAYFLIWVKLNANLACV